MYSFAYTLFMNIDAIEKGYYEVIVDGVKVSQHTKPLKAIARAQEEKAKDQSAYIYVKQPNIEPIVEIDESAEIQQLKDDYDMIWAELERFKAMDGGTVVDPPIDPPITELLAFPTAKGAGAYTTGGRGGEVVHVTNLNATGAGSLKEALSMTVKRTIVFDVSGVINIEPLLYLDATNSDFYLAGQSAPTGGVTIGNGRVYFSGASNYRIRHMRFKGGYAADLVPNSGDGIGSNSFNSVKNIQDIIVDHCSFGFGYTMPVWVDQGDNDLLAQDITIQNCLFSETDKGVIIGKDVDGQSAYRTIGSLSFLKNIFYNTQYRVPNTTGNHENNTDDSIEVINNLSWQTTGRISRGAGNQNLNHIGNASYGGSVPLRDTGVNLWSSGWTPKIHTSGNLLVYPNVASEDLTSTIAQMNADNTLSWKDFNAGVEPEYGDQLPANFFVAQYPFRGVAPTVLDSSVLRTTLPNDNGCNARLNEDGSVSTNLDTYDADYLGNILADTMVAPIDKSSYSLGTITPASRPAGFYVSNPHIPEAYLIAKGLPQTPTVHTELNEAGYTRLEEYLYQIDL